MKQQQQQTGMQKTLEQLHTTTPTAQREVMIVESEQQYKAMAAMTKTKNSWPLSKKEKYEKVQNIHEEFNGVTSIANIKTRRKKNLPRMGETLLETSKQRGKALLTHL